MLYEIDGKIYVLASNKYREVKVEKDSNGGYDVKAVVTSEPIERSPEVKEKANMISTEEAYKKKVKERLEFLYVESGKKNYLSHAVAGQPFDEEVFQLLLQDLFGRTDMESNWDYSVVDTEAEIENTINFRDVNRRC